MHAYSIVAHTCTVGRQRKLRSYWNECYCCFVVVIDKIDFIQIFYFTGPSSLFHGIYPCVIRAFPANAAMLLAYEASRWWMKAHRPAWIS